MTAGYLHRDTSNLRHVLKTGTTTVGFVARDFVVLATDTRATAGFFVAHRKTRKLHKIADHIAMTIAGRVADAQSIIDILRANVKHYEVSRGKRISVRSLASLTSSFLFTYRFYPFQAQLILAGVDDEGPQLYNIDLFGGFTRERIVATGSGSPVALGVLESEYREDLTLEEGVRLGFKSVAAAIRRDIGSGDSIDVAYVSPHTLFRELSREEKAPLYDAYVKPYLLT